MLIELNEKEYGVVKKVLSTINEAALTMRSVNKTLNKSFGPDYNVVADTSPRKCYVQYYDFDTGIYVTGDLKVDRLTDLTLEEWIEETKKVAEKVKKSKIKRIGEAYDAVHGRERYYGNHETGKKINLTPVAINLPDKVKELIEDEFESVRIIHGSGSMSNTHKYLRIDNEYNVRFVRIFDMENDPDDIDMITVIINSIKNGSNIKDKKKTFIAQNTPSMAKWIINNIKE